MTNVLKPHDYDESVFINCPFDSAYEPLFHGLIFCRPSYETASPSRTIRGRLTTGSKTIQSKP
jgi:hypothetical protein